MKKKLIIFEIFERHFLFNLNKYDEIYAEKRILDKLNIKSNIKKIIVPNDIMTATDFRRINYSSSFIKDELFDSFFKKQTYFNPFDLDKKLLASVIKKKVLVYICDIFYAHKYAMIVKEKYKLDDNINIFSSKINFSIYKRLEKIKKINSKINYPIELKIFAFFYNLFKNLYFLTKLIFFPELKLMKFKKIFNVGIKKKIKKFITSVRLSGIRLGGNEASMDFFINDKFKKNEVVFVIDEPQKKEYIDEVKKSDYEVVDFEKDLEVNLSLMDYLSKTYLYISTLRTKFLFFGILHPFTFNILFRSLKSIYGWELFYSQYETKSNVVVQSDFLLLTPAIHKKYNVKSIFVYISLTEEIFLRENLTKNSCSDYACMTYDMVVSNKLSNDWFKTQEVNIKEYVNLSPIWSDLIARYSYEKVQIKKEMGVPKNSKLLVFFDHSLGRRGVLDQKDYNYFLSSINQLIVDKKDSILALKTKTSLTAPNNYKLEGENKVLFDSLLKNKRFFYINDSKFSNYQSIACADVLVSAPISSVIAEAICGGIKTIIYDPQKKYVFEFLFSHHFKDICSYNYESLLKTTNFYLDANSNSYFDTLKSNLFKMVVDSKDVKSPIRNFQKLLKNINEKKIE